MLPDTLAAKCDGPDQFQNFDRIFRAVVAASEAAVDKEEAKWRRAQAKKRAKQLTGR